MLDNLKKLFPEFEFTQSEIMGKPCYHGVIMVNPFTMRKTHTKARVKYGNVVMFISSEMYSGTIQSFFYGMIFQHQNITEFRKQISFDVEANKVFVSNKDVNLVVNQLKNRVNMYDYVLKPNKTI
jgi:hypothetical protein